MTLLFTVISLILGLRFLKDHIVVSVGLTLFFVIFIIYRFNWKKSIFFFSLFLLGALFSHLPRVYNNPENIYSGVVISSKQNYFLMYSHGERFYVYEKQNDREIGDFVVVTGVPSQVKFATYESQLDFSQYLSNKGVTREISAKKIENSFACPFRFKNSKTTYLSILNSQAAPLVDAMLFNTKDYSSDVVSLADSINLIFLLSTAGIYFSFFFRSLKKFIFLKFEDRESHILALLIVAPYVLYSFPKIGVLRVFLVNILNIPKKETKNKDQAHKSSFLSKLSLTHLLLLVLNPYSAFDSGFLIGFSLTLFLYFFRISYRTKISWKSRLVTPVLVFLFIQPFATFRSGSLHILTFFEQMLLIPVNEVFIFFAIFSYVGLPITGLINFLGNFIYQSLKLCEKIDLSVPIYDYGALYVALFYILAVLGLILFESKCYQQVKALGVVGISLLGFGLVPIQPFITSGVYFVNVGQGDSILIQDHFHAVMIDTGGNLSFDMAKKTLIPFMNKKHIYHLDALITTHDDFDHSGAANSLIENFQVRSYLKSDADFPYQVGNISLTNLNHYEAKEENDSSLVLYMEFYGTKYLFIGDAPIEIEKKIILDNPTLTCDILKVGHHGSKTSSDDSFINQLRPKEAVISVGKKNRYGHPNKEVLDILSRYDVKIRRTDEEGTISYLSYFCY